MLQRIHVGGDRDCLECLLANTPIDVNSINNNGETPIMYSLHQNKLNGSKFLVEKGANFFMKRNNGIRAIDHHVVRGRGNHVSGNPNEVFLGLEVLQHALDLR